MKKIYFVIAAALLAVAIIPRTFRVNPKIDIVLAPIVYEAAGEILATSTIARAELIDEYLSRKKMPLAGTGEIMIEASDRNKIDWRLLPALAVRESSGGLHACGFNPFGWASCSGPESKFSSWKESIDRVAKALGSGRYYRGKTLRQKLETYNPPTIVEDYADSVIRIMNEISKP